MIITLFIENIIDVQEKLIEGQDQKLDDDFLQAFAEIIGNRWPCVVPLFSLSACDINEIRNSGEKQRPLCMLRKWNSKQTHSYGQLFEMLQTISLFQ